MNWFDFKFILWILIASFAVYAAFSSVTIGGLLLFSVVALLCVFVLTLAGGAVVWAMLYIAVLFAAFAAGGMPGVISAAAVYLLSGSAMSQIIKNSKDFGTTLCFGTAVFCFGIVAVDRLVVIPRSGGLRVIYSSAVDSAVRAFSEAARMVAPSEQGTFEKLEAVMTSSAYATKLLFPCIVVIVALAVCFLTLLLSRKFIANIPVPPFSMFKAPRVLAYAYCIGYLISGVVSSSAGLIIVNAVMVLSAVMFVCGLSFFRTVTKVIPSKFLSAVVFIFALPVCFLFPFVMTVAGTFDAVFNFRRFFNEKK